MINQFLQHKINPLHAGNGEHIQEKFTIREILAPTKKKPPVYFEAFMNLGQPHAYAQFYNQYEWLRLIKEANFEILEQNITREIVFLDEWAKQCSEYVRERLQIMLIQCPEAIQAHIQPQYAGTDRAQFSLPYIEFVLQYK